MLYNLSIEKQEWYNMIIYKIYKMIFKNLFPGWKEI